MQVILTEEEKVDQHALYTKSDWRRKVAREAREEASRLQYAAHPTEIVLTDVVSTQPPVTAQSLLAKGLPRCYRRSRARQMYYREGFTDGFEGRPKPDVGFEEDLRRHQGDAAWRAYEHGHGDGCQSCPVVRR